MSDSRLIPDFKNIIIIDIEIEEDIREFGKSNTDFPGYESRKKDTLYVIRVNKAEQNKRLFLATQWPKSYQALSVRDLVLFVDDEELWGAEVGDHPLPAAEDEKNTPEIAATTFAEYAITLESYCKKEIQKYNQDIDSNKKLLPTSHPPFLVREDGGGRSGSSSNGEDSDNSDNSDVGNQPVLLFSKEEEKEITDFFGSDLIDSVRELSKIFNKKAEADRKASRNHIKESGKQEFETLIKTLKYQTPRDKLDKKAASANEGVKAIAEAAKALKDKLKLTTLWQKVGKWILRIVGAIAAAAPGAYYGAKYGAVAGAAIGGGVASVPAATIGAVGGGLAGGVFGLWAGHKAGKWLSHRNSTIAKAYHSATIDEAVNRRMERVK